MEILELKPVAEQLFKDMRELSFDGVGVTRDSYGAGETAAASYLRDFALRHGLQAQADRAANLVLRLPQADTGAPATWVGSHLDSVPQGGNFDGLAGIVAGLLCQFRQKRSGRHSRVPLQVVGFRGEESAWFGKAYMGSGALLGKLSADDLALAHRHSGASLAACMTAAGADVEAIRDRKSVV